MRRDSACMSWRGVEKEALSADLQGGVGQPDEDKVHPAGIKRPVSGGAHQWGGDRYFPQICT